MPRSHRVPVRVTWRYMDYAARNPTWHEEDGPAKAAGLYTLLHKHQIRPKTVLEVGCGTGVVLASMIDWWRADDLSPTCEGWDLAELPIARAQLRTTDLLTFHHGALPTDRRADLLLCVDVFEHLDDDVSFLRGLCAHAPWMLFRIPLDNAITDRVTGRTAGFREQYGHLHAYTRRTALERLDQAGIEVVDWDFHRIEPEVHGLRVGLSAVRALAFRAQPRWAVRVLGGWSLVVLGRSPV